MISVRHLSKVYGGARALVDVTFDVAPGECFGVAGSDGSGRTTLLHILAALVPPSSGQVSIAGTDVARDPYGARRRVSFSGTAPVVAPEGIRVDEYCGLVAAARLSTPREAADGVRDALSRAALDGAAIVTELPDGARRRLALALALLPAADAVLLDDPLHGLDGPWRARSIEWLHDACTRGAAVVVAGTDGAGLEATCQRVARLDAGRLVDTR